MFGMVLIMMLTPPVAATAQTPAPAPVVVEVTPAQVGQRPEPTGDPARLAAARPVIDQIWPTGTYARAMKSVFDQMSQMAVDQMSGGSAGALPGKDAPGAAVRGAIAEMTVNDDPHAEERMRITMRVMTDEFTILMTQFEPGIREALTSAYAKRFTIEQLGTLHSFFETPTGTVYARESVAIMMGPDMIEATQKMLPKLLEAMPAIMAKAEAATKDLPPPPKRKRR